MRADLAEPLGFHGKQRVHRGLATPAEGQPHGRKMHLPKRAGPALAGQRVNSGALACRENRTELFEIGRPGPIQADGHHGL